MKNLLLSLFSLVSLAASAQITLQSTDMPNVGDQLLVSNGVPSPLIDLSQTGANYTWDFSQLVPVSQDTIGFVAVNTTAAFFQLTFGLPFSPNYSTIVSPFSFPDSLAGISVSDVLGFYRESTTEFKQTGYGATLNGAAVPIAFSSPDILYKFPLSFSDQDSSLSGFVMSLPGTVYFSRNQKRVNKVDGWGTVITPFGSFQALRQVSTVFAHDSVSLDSTNIGLDQPVMKEYKWLAKNTVTGKPMGIPVLQINTQTVFGQEAISSIVYRDSVRQFGPQAAPEFLANQVHIGPNPFDGQITISLEASQSAPLQVELTDLLGRMLTKAIIPAGIRQMSLPVNSDLHSAAYFIRLTGENGSVVKKLVRFR